MNNKICPKCGTQNPEDALNCANCGDALSIETIMDNGEKQAEGIYCSACGHLNATWRSQCEECKTSLANPKSNPPTKARKTIRWIVLGISSFPLVCVAFYLSSSFGWNINFVGAIVVIGGMFLIDTIFFKRKKD